MICENKKPNMVAIIPARGGSKGLKKKNLRLLAGKPLIAHSIEAALQCKMISRCIVSTEDPEIKSVSQQWGAEVIDRPLELAEDLTPSQDVVRHVLGVLDQEKNFPDFFVLLQATSPLRTFRHLNECISHFFEKDAASIISVAEILHHPYKSCRIEDGLLSPFFDVESLSKPRQLLPKLFMQNGAIYVVPARKFLETNSFFIPPSIPYIMEQNASIDIDSEVELQTCEVLLKNRF